MQNENNPPKQETWYSIRAPGCVIFLFSALGAYISIVRPLIDMRNQKEYVWTSAEVVIMSVVGMCFGLMYGVVGPRILARMVGSPKKWVAKFWTIFLIVLFLVIVALAAAVWSVLVNWLGYG
jgi:dipeptide/tripeptide permease